MNLFLRMLSYVEMIVSRDGFKVCEQHDKTKCFSNKGLPHTRAVAQLKAICINEFHKNHKPKYKK